MSAEFDDVLTNQPVVIDNGSGAIKAGFAGLGQIPPLILSVNFLVISVGRPKHIRVMAGALEGDVFIGRRAQEFRGLLKIKYPMEHGIVTDWDDMERIWSWVYAEELGTLSEELSSDPTQHPVLLTEAPLNPRSNRDVAAQIFFDTFNVPALFTSVQAVLSLDVTDHLQLLLRKAGHHLHTTAEREVVRTIKEKCCYVAVNPVKEEKDTLGRTEDFRLPDGNVVQLGPERFRAPEILFNPELIGQEYAGVHQVVVDSINRVDLDLRKSLFSNIVLSGGSTLCRGFGDRLLNEVKKLALKDIKIKIYAPPERKYSTWIGGSILAGLSTFKKMWVSAEEYQEDPDIIHKKSGF
ncbi:Actin-2 [Termitomyces sp. Mi166|nr:Actin-2 [Termitomyces sp. Mi166\